MAAWAVPHVSIGGSSGVVFPRPLRASDVALMRRIFAFQARGNIPEAIRASAGLADSLLMGHVLADRYLGRHHRSTPQELAAWLAQYPDLADAPAIHALLRSRLPAGAVPPPAPQLVFLARSSEPDPVPEDIDPPRNDLVRDAALDRAVLDRMRNGDAASALRLIRSRRSLSPAYAAQLRAEVAQALFAQNADVDALRVAQAAVRDVAAKDQPSLGYYIGGLAAWRLQRTELARSLFEGGTTAANTSAHLHAATAFWASRASRALRDGVTAMKWLQVAAAERLTLHGVLARRILRMDTGILPDQALLSQADVDAVASTPQGWRAFALLQIGQPDRMEAELRGLWGTASGNSVFQRSILLVASAAGLADCAAQMASVLQNQDGQRHEELRFPVPRLRPAGGFSIDPALVYALTRLESNFDTEAISPAGARGLMQIMPATAQYMMGSVLFAPERLHEPSSNLQIGQRYVTYLSRLDGINNDLIRMLVSYNSGPGNFARWGPDIRDGGDPLLFIEAIPVPETRAFVAHALVYSWIYAARLHLPAPSLDELSAGEFPRFTPRREASKMALLEPSLH